MEIIAHPFDLSQTINYTLSIRFIPNGFCFIVFNRFDNKILYFSKITDPNKDNDSLLRENISKISVLKQNFENIFFLCDTFFYTLIPSSIFEEKDKVHFWMLNFGEYAAKETVLLHDDLKIPEITNLYAVPAEKKEFLTTIFPDLKFINQQSIHITSSLIENKQSNNTQVYLHLHPNFFDATIVQKGKILLASSYYFQNTDEFLYFTLNLYEQIHLDPYSVEIILSGEIDKNDEKITILQQYVRDVRLKTLPSYIQNTEFSEMPDSQYYINLFNLPLCVS